MRTPVVLFGVLSLASLALSSTSARAAGDEAPGVSPSAAGATTTTVTTTAVTNKATDKVAPGTVVVHLESSQSVNLEHRQGVGATAGPWQYQCTSPCDAAVPSGDEFRITGTGLNPSKTFILKSGDGQKVTLEVSPGKKSKATAGFALLGVGAALAIGGTVTLIAGSRGEHTFPQGSDTSTTNNSNTNVILVGTSLILGGVIVAVLGGAWAVDNSHTGVGTGDKSPPPASDNATSPTTPTENPSNGGSTIVSSRVPFFVETQAQKMASSVPTYTVPLFTKTF